MNLPTKTIADIAKEAGVGTATVDRVLNGRPGVNAETMKKVMAAVQALGEPSVLRGRPRQQQGFRFAYVMPSADLGLFNKTERLIAQAAGEFRHKHITEVTYRINAEDPARFADELSKITDCDGIVLIAPDLPPIKLAINELVRSGTHVVTLFTDIAGSMRQAYVGADNRAAGRTAGLLIARMAANPAKNTLLLLSQSTRMAAQIDRRIGFAQVIEERFPNLVVERYLDLANDDALNDTALETFLREKVDCNRLAGVYNVGDGTAGVLRVLASLPAVRSASVIAHDLTEQHRTFLINGSLAFLLDQDIHYSVMSAARVLRDLCENVRGALNIVQPRVEIITAENLH